MSIGRSKRHSMECIIHLGRTLEASREVWDTGKAMNPGLTQKGKQPAMDLAATPATAFLWGCVWVVELLGIRLVFVLGNDF